ncbi:unnamed protein product [Sphagnum tenellum]
MGDWKGSRDGRSSRAWSLSRYTSDTGLTTWKNGRGRLERTSREQYARIIINSEEEIRTVDVELLLSHGWLSYASASVHLHRSSALACVPTSLS